MITCSKCISVCSSYPPSILLLGSWSKYPPGLVVRPSILAIFLAYCSAESICNVTVVRVALLCYGYSYFTKMLSLCCHGNRFVSVATDILPWLTITGKFGPKRDSLKNDR